MFSTSLHSCFSNMSPALATSLASLPAFSLYYTCSVVINPGVKAPLRVSTAWKPQAEEAPQQKQKTMGILDKRTFHRLDFQYTQLTFHQKQ